MKTVGFKVRAKTDAVAKSITKKLKSLKYRASSWTCPYEFESVLEVQDIRDTLSSSGYVTELSIHNLRSFPFYKLHIYWKLNE